ncbi:hypothetical protein ACFLT7_05425 [candidate division KSB1 bacterium]
MIRTIDFKNIEASSLRYVWSRYDHWPIGKWADGPSAGHWVSLNRSAPFSVFHADPAVSYEKCGKCDTVANPGVHYNDGRIRCLQCVNIVEKGELVREELLRKYRKKQIKRFLQIDALTDGFDEIVHPDADGHVLCKALVWELSKSGCPVSVQIHEGAKRKEVLHMLRKIESWIAKEWTDLIPVDWNDREEQDYEEFFFKSIDTKGIDIKYPYRYLSLDAALAQAGL